MSRLEWTLSEQRFGVRAGDILAMSAAYNGVVVMAPLADDDLGFFQAIEDFAVEQLIPQLAVEAFAISVLPGTSRRDVVACYLFGIASRTTRRSEKNSASFLVTRTCPTKL
jgi:hypothetical protein